MSNFVKKNVIMDAEAMRRAIVRISHEIIERNKGVDNVVIVGIRTRGVPIAERLAATIKDIENVELPDLIFSGLMKYDANGKPVEDLAESYTFDKDTNTYTFKLRDGVKWHDGEDFNAEDVVYTYKELTEDETLGASITSNYQDITSIEAPDDQTVIFTLDQYDAAMLDYFTMGILPEHLLEP